MELDILNVTLSTATQGELECTLANLHHESKPGLCPPTYDGVLCWPPAIAGSIVHQPCSFQLHGIRYDTSQNASKTCYANGTWENYTDFSDCYDHTQRRVDIDANLTGTAWVEVTEAMYISGFGISLGALCFAVWIFAYFKELRCLRNTIHTNLMCTYIFADILWLVVHFTSKNPFPNESNEEPSAVLCGVLHVTYHYFHLTGFFWMFVEGLYLYMLVVETFTRNNIKLRGYLIIGWGIPLIIVIAWATSKVLIYEETKQDELKSCCSCVWLMPNISDWLFQICAVIVLIANVAFLVMIMWVLITKLRSSNNVETQQYKKASKALLVLTPLLGITYILLIAGPTSNIYEGIRIFLLSTQGLMVALFYCFLNTEVQNTMRHHIARWRESRNISTRYNYSKDWSPNTRTESVRLYSKPDIAPYRKRESTASESTTLTVTGSSGCGGGRLSNGSSALPPLRSIAAPLLELPSDKSV